MPYTPIGWKDFPNEETPLSATNLNKMDMQIKENTEKLDNFNPDLPENMLICDDEAPEETEILPNVADRLTDETASYTASDIKDEFDEVKDNLSELKKYNSGSEVNLSDQTDWYTFQADGYLIVYSLYGVSNYNYVEIAGFGNIQALATASDSARLITMVKKGMRAKQKEHNGSYRTSFFPFV